MLSTGNATHCWFTSIAMQATEVSRRHGPTVPADPVCSETAKPSSYARGRGWSSIGRMRWGTMRGCTPLVARVRTRVRWRHRPTHRLRTSCHVPSIYPNTITILEEHILSLYLEGVRMKYVGKTIYYWQKEKRCCETAGAGTSFFNSIGSSGKGD